MNTPERNEKMLFYDTLAKSWDSVADQHEVGKRLRLIFGRLLKKSDVLGKRVLDAGAGTGYFSKVLMDWGAKLVSMDIGPNLLEEIRKKCASRTILGSLLKMPFDDGSFELVLCTEAIEHTTDPRRAVSELCRVTGPGGVLLITVPNRVWRPAILAARALRLKPHDGYENWVWYSQLADWVRSEGLNIEHQSGFNLLPHFLFCKPAYERLDDVAWLHPFMINIALKARKPQQPHSKTARVR